MKKLCTALLALFYLTFSVFAQDVDEWQRADGSLEGFTVGSKWYTFVTDANVRSGPSTTASVVGKLPIGTQITVEEVSTETLVQRGVKLPWLKVNTPIGKGYVWGGFMALASIQTPAGDGYPNAGTLYLTGVSAYDETKHEIMVQVRVAKDGKELAKSEFSTTGDLSYYPSFEVTFEPFTNVKATLSVNYYYPACGYASGNNLLFWTSNNTLTKVLETSSVSEGGVFYSSEEWILPTQRGGIGDHILVTKDDSEFKEKGDDYVRTKQTFSIVVHKWNGTKLIKVREMK